MALTRKYLKSMGLSDEQIDSVIEEHTNTVNGLKDDLRTYKEDAEKLPAVQKELDDLKQSTADYDSWKKKYNDEHTAFENFKKDIEDQKNANALKEAYKALLKAANVDEKRLDTILKVTDLSSRKLNKDGKFDDEKELTEGIKNEWKDFIVTTSEKGAPVDNPPAGAVSADSDADYIRKRAAQRHASTYGAGKEE